MSPEARKLLEIVRQRYGAFLEPDQMEPLLKDLDDRVKSGAALRAVKLANAVEPDVTFRAGPSAKGAAGGRRTGSRR